VTGRPGQLNGLGVGPGDPELITLRALRLLRQSPVVAYFAAAGRSSNARQVVRAHLAAGQEDLPLVYPVTTERLGPEVSYEALLSAFYDRSAERIAAHLDRGRDVAVLCEGDPFLYGSFMYLHGRLAGRYRTLVVPGVPSIVAGPAALGMPLAARDETLSVVSAVLPEADLEARIRAADSVVVLKVGRHLAKVRRVLDRLGLLERARYVERATTDAERLLPLADVDPATAPYFSMVVIPSSLAPTR
jgi:precorrin-2/cobalt-factor-2 C20-methyltransferase